MTWRRCWDSWTRTWKGRTWIPTSPNPIPRSAEAGERVMVASRIPGLGASFGRPGEDQAYTVLTVRGGRIVAMRDCRDRREALKVAGLEDSAG